MTRSPCFPDPLRGVVEGQLYAQYPEANLTACPETALEPPAGAETWTAELHLTPDLFPIKRHPQFTDANRRTVDPIDGILSALGNGGHVSISLSPAHHLRKKALCPQ